MLPNHAPLHVAEAFQTLEALFPGRIDLGIGRAPGSDPRTALALRGGQGGPSGDDLPQLLSDLFAFGGGGFPNGHPFQSVSATPRAVPLPPVWLLGSSDYSAYLAAQLGLGFAFAHHINPTSAVEAIRAYRDNWQPSEHGDKPHAIVTASVVVAESAARADELATSMDLAWLRLYAGRPAPFPSPEEARAYPYTPAERAQVEATRARMILGDPDAVRAQICRLVGQTGADEVMVNTIVHSHADRVHSYELLAEAFEL